MNTANLAKLQFWFLMGASALLLWLAPSVWHYSPDGGIYIGTAKSMVETGQYWFNGYPNLLYYPGFSSVLSLPIFLFGLNFQILHLICAAIVVLCIWLARSYFSAERYGIVGIAAPVMLLTARIFHRQAFNILSDGLFLALVLSTLLLWRKYEETSARKYLMACCMAAAAAPLVRFEGVFVCAALGIALLIGLWRHNSLDGRAFLRLAAICVAIITPFALWTLRNWMLHTPDTFNMANKLLFGLNGLQLYIGAESAATSDEALWHFGAYRVLLLLAALPKTFFIVNIAEILPSLFLAIPVVGLCMIGAKRWFASATMFERVFAILSLVFLLVWTFKGNERSLYIVPRYWLSVLPFVIVMIGFGFAALYDAVKSRPLRHMMSAVTGVVVVMAVLSAVIKVSLFGVKPTYFRNADVALQKIADYLDRNAAPEVPIAAVDWGVIPLRLNRQSYLITNDSSHQISLRRMLNYRTAYLVILEQKGPFTPAAYAIVRKYSTVFKPVLDIRPDGPGPVGAVYKVDLRAIEAVLGASGHPRRQTSR